MHKESQNWIMQRIWTMAGMELEVYLQCRWPARELLRERDLKFWYKYLKLFEDDGVCADGAGVWDATENPIKTLRWDDPDMFHGGNDNED
jgi:hypothetical protein